MPRRSRRDLSCPAFLAASALALAAQGQPLSTTFVGGSQAAGVMFDLTATFDGLSSSHAILANSGGAAVTVWYREGTYVGHESDPKGWIFANMTSMSGGGHVFIWLPQLRTNAPIGVFIQTTSSPAEVITVSPIPPAAASYSNSVVTLSGGVAKGAGGFAGATTPGMMVNGTFYFKMCYANCDSSTVPPWLNVMDFICFNNLFASGSPAANCDRSTTPPLLNVNDFVCYLNAFVAGCSAP